MKQCGKCKQNKENSQFYKNRSELDGFSFYCKECKKTIDRLNYLKNNNKIKKRVNDYRLKNNANIQENKKDYYQENKEKVKTKSIANYYKNHQKNKSSRRRYYQENKEKINTYVKNKKSKDLSYRLACNLRTRLNQAIRNNEKIGSAVKDLGCTITELKQYLESKFQPGMTWANWSRTGWHIDHIIPLSKFDLTNREELLKACHYTNLQPLWAKDNLRKSANVI